MQPACPTLFISSQGCPRNDLVLQCFWLQLSQSHVGLAPSREFYDLRKIQSHKEEMHELSAFPPAPEVNQDNWGKELG